LLRTVHGDTTSIIPWDGPVTLAGVGVSSARRFAGIGQYGTTSCSQSSPVGALHVHGSSDDVVLFNGGLRNGKPHVGARPMIEQMATVNGCSPTAEENTNYVDVVRDLSGAETQVSRWSGCARGVRTEPRTIPNGSHVPQLSTDFSTLVHGFLASHSR